MSRLQIAEDLEHQRRTWRAERIGWALLAALVIAALGGLFGRGLAGKAVARSTHRALEVEHDRFWRRGSPMTLRFRVRPGQGAEHVELWLDRAYLESVRAARFLPEPARSIAGPDRMHYVFEARPEGGELVSLTLEVEPHAIGMLRGRAGVAGGPTVSFEHFVYP